MNVYRKNFLAIMLLFAVSKPTLSLDDYDKTKNFAIKWKKNNDLYLTIFQGLLKIKEINLGNSWEYIHKICLCPNNIFCMLLGNKNRERFIARIKDGENLTTTKFGLSKIKDIFGPNLFGKTYITGKDAQNFAVIISLTDNIMYNLSNFSIIKISKITEILDKSLYIEGKDKDNNTVILKIKDDKISKQDFNLKKIFLTIIPDLQDILYVAGVNQENEEVISYVKDGEVLCSSPDNMTGCQFVHGPDRQGVIYVEGNQGIISLNEGKISLPTRFGLNSTHLRGPTSNGYLYINGKDKNHNTVIIPIENGKILPPTKYDLKEIYNDRSLDTYLDINGILYVYGINHNDEKVIHLINNNKIIKIITPEEESKLIGIIPDKLMTIFKENYQEAKYRITATIDNESHILIEDCKEIYGLNTTTCFPLKKLLKKYDILLEKLNKYKLKELLEIINQIPIENFINEDKIIFYDFFFKIKNILFNKPNLSKKVNNFLMQIAENSEHTLHSSAAALLFETYQGNIFLKHENMSPLILSIEKEKAGDFFNEKLNKTVFAALLLKIIENSDDDLLKSKIRYEYYLDKIFNALNDLLDNKFKEFDLSEFSIFYKYMEIF